MNKFNIAAIYRRPMHASALPTHKFLSFLSISWSSWWKGGRHGSRAVAEGFYILIHRPQAEKGAGSSLGFWTLKTNPSDIPPATRPCFLILPTVHHLKTKHANIWVCGDHFHPTSLTCMSQSGRAVDLRLKKDVLIMKCEDFQQDPKRLLKSGEIDKQLLRKECEL